MHLQQLDSIKDPVQLAVETRRYLHLTNEILALLERRTQLTEHASWSSVPPSGSLAPSLRPGWSEPKMGRLAACSGVLEKTPGILAGEGIADGGTVLLDFVELGCLEHTPLRGESRIRSPLL